HVSLVRQVRADEKLEAIEIRVLARGASKFVHEAFAIELVRRLSDATPRAHGHVKPAGVARVAVARHVIPRGHVERRLGSEPVALHAGAYVERDWPPLGVETG